MLKRKSVYSIRSWQMNERNMVSSCKVDSHGLRKKKIYKSASLIHISVNSFDLLQFMRFMWLTHIELCVNQSDFDCFTLLTGIILRRVTWIYRVFYLIQEHSNFCPIVLLVQFFKCILKHAMSCWSPMIFEHCTLDCPNEIKNSMKEITNTRDGGARFI